MTKLISKIHERQWASCSWK